MHMTSQAGKSISTYASGSGWQVVRPAAAYLSNLSYKLNWGRCPDLLQDHGHRMQERLSCCFFGILLAELGNRFGQEAGRICGCCLQLPPICVPWWFCVIHKLSQGPQQL